MHDWEKHVELEITDASIDQFRLLQIAIAITDMREIDLIPETVYEHLSNLIRKVGYKST
jgi:hypothetical protein